MDTTGGCPREPMTPAGRRSEEIHYFSRAEGSGKAADSFSPWRVPAGRRRLTLGASAMGATGFFPFPEGANAIPAAGHHLKDSLPPGNHRGRGPAERLPGCSSPPPRSAVLTSLAPPISSRKPALPFRLPCAFIAA